MGKQSRWVKGLPGMLLHRIPNLRGGAKTRHGRYLPERFSGFPGPTACPNVLPPVAGTVRVALRAAAVMALLATPAFLYAGAGRPSPTKASKASIVTRKPFISLSPSVVMLQGKPDESFQKTLRMMNGTPIPLTFRMQAMDVKVENGKREFVPAGEMPGSIAATAVFSVPEITIAPYHSGKVSVTLTAPPQTPIRAVVVEFRGTNPIATPFKAKATATASLGSLITFSLSNNVQIDASQLRIAGQSPTRNAAVEALLRNNGSDPGVVAGEVAILKQAGGIYTKASFATQRLLPGEELPFKAELPVELQPGQYRVFATFLCNGKTITETANYKVR